MEKLLEDKDYKFYRFQCDCGTAKDAMDIGVDREEGEKKAINITMSFNSNGLWDRLKFAWHVVRGYWTWREFVVREEDYGNLSAIFDPLNEFSKLP